MSIETRDECIDRYGEVEPISVEQAMQQRLADAQLRQQQQVDLRHRQYQAHQLYEVDGAYDVDLDGSQGYERSEAELVNVNASANRRTSLTTTQQRKVASIGMEDLLELLVDEHRADLAAQETRLGKQERRAEEREARERRREEAVERERVQKAQAKAARAAASKLARAQAEASEDQADETRSISPELGLAVPTPRPPVLPDFGGQAMDVDRDDRVGATGTKAGYAVPDDVVQFLSRSEQAKLRMQGQG